MPTFLQKLNDQLKKKYPKGDTVAYSLTTGNRFPEGRDWLAQTPNVWGRKAKDLKPGEHGTVVKQTVRTLVGSARSRVDITTLAQFPDGDFLKAIQNGLVDVAKSGRSVKVRILAGYPPSYLAKQSTYLKALIEPLKKLKGGKLEIYAAAQRTGPLNVTWNHAKIVAVDGERAMVGGENLWTKDYLKSAPVHDLNIEVEGPAVFDMHRFANRIWKEVCGYKLGWKPAYWKSGAKKVSTKCLQDINGSAKRPASRGGMRVLGVGRYGRLDSGKMNCSDEAFLWAIDQAQDRVCLSQQDLIGPLRMGTWTAGIKAICRAVERQCRVYIVVSNTGAKSGSGNPYSNTWTHAARTTYEAIQNVYYGDATIIHPHIGPFLDDYLHVASLRFGPSDEWPSGKKFANHAKFILIDDQAFYIGSSNFYPSDLVEYGVFIDDPEAVRHVETTYWDQLWKYSKREEYRPKYS